MRIAALDLGSNTFLMLVVDVDDLGNIHKVHVDETRVVRLGQGVHKDRRFHPDALKRARDCFADYRSLMDQLAVESVVAVATSAARDVENREEFLELGRQYGIPIEVIPGQQEAELTFLGATSDFSQDKQWAVIDVGGGSTEIIGRGADGEVRGCSVDVGSVRLTEMFISDHPVVHGELKSLQAHVRSEFEKAKAKLPVSGNFEVIAVAGTPTTLACLELQHGFVEEQVHRFKLTRHQLQAWIRKLSNMSVIDRENLPGMPPKRADVIVAGASILDAALEVLGQSEITVSTRGVRYGLAMSWRLF